MLQYFTIHSIDHLFVYTGLYAHTAERDWECNTDVKNSNCDDRIVDDIAEQLVHGEVGKNLKVIFGGGRYNFIDTNQKDEEGNIGKRTDGKDLITEWINNKKPNEQRSYVWNKVIVCIYFLSMFWLKRVFFLFYSIYSEWFVITSSVSK